MYSLLEFNRAEVRFEALFLARKSSVLKEYEMVDGNYLTVSTLSPENLLQEKIAACLKRGKVRDLFDVFFLLRLVKEQPQGLDKLQQVQIVDEATLPTIVLFGFIPTVKEMKEYVARWGK